VGDSRHLDIHTHYDIETLSEPELSEPLRHGVTTVLLGSCSLSTVYLDSVDAGDIIGRVEAIPRSLSAVCGGRSTATTTL
jgi:N-acyl-D-aspartate/D-glutamate deacylase